MSPQVWWYMARATGYVAWGLVTISVVLGLLFSTRLTKGRPTRAWLLDLHRFVAGAAVAFTALHLIGLVADTYVHFGVAELFVPFASSWKPEAVALGVVAFYLLAAVEISSLLMRWLPRKLWHGIHLSSYVLFWLATFHLLAAGTDSTNALSRLAAAVAMAVVVLLTLVRALSDRATPARRTGRGQFCAGPPTVRRRDRRGDGLLTR